MVRRAPGPAFGVRDAVINLASPYLRVGASSRFSFALLVAALVLSGVEGCVPSPTATPPLATPFPTLPRPTDTPPPTATLTTATTVPPSPSATLTLTRVPPTAASSPTATPVHESLLPLVQVFALPSTGPVSANQPVALSILAADSVGLARLELYDENVLYNSTPAPDPAPLTISIVITWKSEKLGLHHLRVIAYDRAGNSSSAAELALEVLDDNRRPSATITVPVGAIDLQMGAPLVLQGVATDDVAVARVDLFVDNQLYTYVNSEKPEGQPPFAVAFMWLPTSAGVHQLFLRAHDNKDQTGDSPPLLVNAVDVQAPALTASYERDEVVTNGTLFVHALALSSNNIARIELWADNEIAQMVASAAPDVQTMLDVQLVWEAGSVGDHTLFVRAYDRAGLNTSTEPQIIHVRSSLARAPTATPMALPATATVPPPLPTPTPQVVLPEPPTIALTTGEDRLALQLPSPVHIHLDAHGSIELDRVELWAFYQGEANPQFLFSDSAKGATDKSFDYAWTPLRAGVGYLFARVVDQLGQTGLSPVTSVYLISPPAPTPTPAFFSLAPRWAAEIPTNKFTVEFLQLGRALRGTFTNVLLNGSTFTGSIMGGAVARDRVEFSVDFATPDAVPRTLDFICLPSAEPAQLACNYQDETGSRGSAVFTPVP
jgi:Big-like domain-containing protein